MVIESNNWLFEHLYVANLFLTKTKISNLRDTHTFY